MIGPVDTLSSRLVYENPWMTVREDTFRRPDGGEGIYFFALAINRPI